MPIDWEKLPEDIKHHPAVMHSRITRLEHRDHMRESKEHFHLASLMGKDVTTPVGNLPLPVAIFLGSALLYWKPEALFSLFGH